MLENALNNLRNASNAQDAQAAAQARQDVSDLLTTYEQTLAVSGYEPSTDTLFVDAAVKAFQTIGLLRRQNPVDAQAILNTYTGELQQLTQALDSIYAQSMDSDVLAAIDNISNGQQVVLAAQVIDKTLQRVFVLTLYNRVTLVLNAFDDLSLSETALEWDRAYSAFQAITGTAARENKVLTADRQSIQSGSNPFLDSRITLAFIRGKAAINRLTAESKEQVAIERERIILPLVRAYLIGVLREVEGIVENRDRNLDEAREKQIEGIDFYQTIERVVARHNPTGNALIKSQLAGDLAVVNADQIISEISRGVIGQINAHLALHEQSFDVNRAQARLYAEVTALYTQMILPDLELRLDATQRIKIENALQDLMEATENRDQSKAQTAQQAISDIIFQYESELLN